MDTEVPKLGACLSRVCTCADARYSHSCCSCKAAAGTAGTAGWLTLLKCLCCLAAKPGQLAGGGLQAGAGAAGPSRAFKAMRWATNGLAEMRQTGLAARTSLKRASCLKYTADSWGLWQGPPGRAAAALPAGRPPSAHHRATPTDTVSPICCSTADGRRGQAVSRAQVCACWQKAGGGRQRWA